MLSVYSSTPLVYLATPFALHSGAFESEAESTNPAEQIAECHGFLIFTTVHALLV